MFVGRNNSESNVTHFWIMTHLVHIDSLRREPVGLDRQKPSLRFLSVVDEDYRFFDRRLIVELGFKQRKAQERSNIRALVPTDVIVVHVDTPQLPHHVQLTRTKSKFVWIDFWRFDNVQRETKLFC